MVALLATLGLVEANELPLSEATDGQETATACGWAGDYPVPPGEVQEVSGRLQDGDCIFTVRGSQRWADPYTFTLTTQSLVTLTLTSSDVDPYLFLRRMGDYSVIEEDDDSGSGRNSRIERQLAAGRYRVDATKYDSPLGSYTLSSRVASSRAEATDGQETASTCVWAGHYTLAPGEVQEVSGRLQAGDCIFTVQGSQRWADPYTFTLTTQSLVTLTLTSSDVDPYLFLREMGDYSVIEEDDDSGSGRNSRIERQLAAGRYRVDATKYDSPSGSYTLSIRVASSSSSGTSRVGVRESSECAVNLGHLASSSRTGSLASADCRDPLDRTHYADIYRFQLTEPAVVTLDLTSSDFDAYLRLLDDTGSQIERDDDGGSGRNSHIMRTLSAGTYRVVATSYRRDTGSYRLQVRKSATTHRLTVEADPSGGHAGHIEILNGTGSTPGQREFRPGQLARITAVPASGWQFNRWSGDAAGQTEETTVTMDGNKRVVARFASQVPTRSQMKAELLRVLYNGLNGDSVRGSGSGNDWGCPFTEGESGVRCHSDDFYPESLTTWKDANWNAYAGGHSGWDASAGYGRTLYPLTSGTVIAAFTYNDDDMACADIAIFDGTNTIVYLHANPDPGTLPEGRDRPLRAGDRVRAGDPLATEGRSFENLRCTGPSHVHVEVRTGSVPVAFGATPKFYARGAGREPGGSRVTSSKTMRASIRFHISTGSCSPRVPNASLPRFCEWREVNPPDVRVSGLRWSRRGQSPLDIPAPDPFSWPAGKGVMQLGT